MSIFNLFRKKIKVSESKAPVLSEEEKYKKALSKIDHIGLEEVKEEDFYLTFPKADRFTEGYRFKPSRFQIKGIDDEVIAFKAFDFYPISRNELARMIVKNNSDEQKASLEIYNKIKEKDVKLWKEQAKIYHRELRKEIRETVQKEVYGQIKTKRLPLTEEEKEDIFTRFGNKCIICNTTQGLHIHHKDKNPSNNMPDNLLLVCGVCHKKYI